MFFCIMTFLQFSQGVYVAPKNISILEYTFYLSLPQYPKPSYQGYHAEGYLLFLLDCVCSGDRSGVPASKIYNHKELAAS